MELKELQESILNAYRNLKNAQEVAFNAVGTRLNADEVVLDRKLTILLEHADDPKKLGANEAARDAAIRQMLRVEIGTQAMAVENERLAQHKLRMAQIDVEFVRAMLRTVEVAAGIERSH